MKIVLSPSKTMKFNKSGYLEDKEILYPRQHKKVLASLRKLSKKELAKALQIKGEILDNTYKNIKNYNTNETYHAFESFTGLVFFNIEKESYKEEEYNYIQKHIRVLDAYYGVLEPGTLIKPYRLDMKAKLGFNLYKHWDIDNHFDDDVIINLASTEFSTMIQKEMITIHFKQFKENKYINQATYSKQARGLFVDYMIKNKIENIEDLKHFNLDNYAFHSDLSDNHNLTFTR